MFRLNPTAQRCSTGPLDVKTTELCCFEFFDQTYKHPKVGVQLTFQAENIDLLIVATELIGDNS